MYVEIDCIDDRIAKKKCIPTYMQLRWNALSIFAIINISL